MLPTSVVISLLCGIAVNLFYKFLRIIWALTENSVPARYSTSPDNALDYYGYQAIAGFAIGFGFVYAGRKMSPSHDQKAGYVLAGIMIIFCVFASIEAVTTEHWAVALNGIAAIVGATIAAKNPVRDDGFF